MKDIKLVEIEIYNYCNRRCNFCPNSLVPSRQDVANPSIMDFSIFKDIIRQLESNNYKGVISFSRYNEPLAFYDLTIQYVEYVRSKLDIKIVANTNGDFLTSKSIEIFDELTIMDYPGRGCVWWQNRLFKLGCTLVSADEEFLRLKSPLGADILVFLNFKQNATVEDRGGVIIASTQKFKNDRQRRQRPCYEPSKFLGIDYNGHTTICCNMNSEFHLQYTTGNITNTSLSEILVSEKRKKYIDIMSSDKYTDYLSPCTYCQKDPGRYTRDEPGILYTGERK